eukprot:scaffold9095_cov125-Isochrysis_galbana.AAC.4
MLACAHTTRTRSLHPAPSATQLCPFILPVSSLPLPSRPPPRRRARALPLPFRPLLAVTALRSTHQSKCPIIWKRSHVPVAPRSTQLRASHIGSSGMHVRWMQPYAARMAAGA